MISLVCNGGFPKLMARLNKASKSNILAKLNEFGKKGVAALTTMTPKDTGLTSRSWSYKIVETAAGYEVRFLNSNVNKGVPIALVIEYGHATRNGGWVAGREYIKPALVPVFERTFNEIWKEVSGT